MWSRSFPGLRRAEWCAIIVAVASMACSHGGAGVAATCAATRGETLEFRWPLEGQLTSTFGKRGFRRHTGVDISAPRGTPVRAARSGQVKYVGRMSGFGRVVVLQHALGVETLYAHNQRNLVRQGQHVARGEAIAKVGTSGNATGPHVHFEVRVGGRSTNPLGCLPPRRSYRS